MRRRAFLLTPLLLPAFAAAGQGAMRYPAASRGTRLACAEQVRGTAPA